MDVSRSSTPATAFPAFSSYAPPPPESAARRTLPDEAAMDLWLDKALKRRSDAREEERKKRKLDSIPSTSTAAARQETRTFTLPSMMEATSEESDYSDFEEV